MKTRTGGRPTDDSPQRTTILVRRVPTLGARLLRLRMSDTPILAKRRIRGPLAPRLVLLSE